MDTHSNPNLTSGTPFKFFQSNEGVSASVEDLINAKVIGFDVETTGLDPFSSSLLLIQLATQDICYIYDARKVDLDLLRPVLENKNVVKIAHNAKFDYKMVKHNAGITTNNLFCTMLAEMVLTSRIRFVKLSYLCKKYLNINLDKTVQTSFVGRKDIVFSQKQLYYAADDSYVLLEIYNQQVSNLISNNLIKTMVLESRLINYISDIELKGCLIDQDAWREHLSAAILRKKKVEDKILKNLAPTIPQLTLLGQASLNLDSSAQLLDALRRRGLEIESTDAGELNRVKNQDEVVPLILNYRRWNTIVTRYGESFLKLIKKETNRIHPVLNQLGAVTGRMSSDKPNEQNIPSYDPGDEESLDLRSCFIPSPGYKYVGADFSQQELRILAELTKDKTLIAAYQQEKDIHLVTASGIFNCSLNKVTKKQRSIAKTVNFLVTYGGSAFTLANKLDISVEKAEEIINGYFKTYSAIRKYMHQVYINALNCGYSETINGRKRYYKIPNKSDADYDKYSYEKQLRSIKKESANHTIQGSGADVTKQALIYFCEAIKEHELDCCPVLIVHDEIVVECVEKDTEKCKKILEDTMVMGFKAFFKKVPMVVAGYIADYWIKN